MNPVLLFPTNLVTALLTAFAEVLLLPVARWVRVRMEGKFIHRELMNGNLVDTHRREYGPFLFPIGRQTPIKIVLVLACSGGVIIATAFAEFGFEPIEYERNITRIVDRVFVSTDQSSFRDGRVLSTIQSHVPSLRPCVTVGRTPCLKFHHHHQTCIRSIYHHAFVENGTLQCADSTTALLRNTSDIDSVFYENLWATLPDQEGEILRISPVVLGLTAKRVRIILEAKELDGVTLVMDSDPPQGAIVFWNESAIFVSLMTNRGNIDLSRENSVEFGVFPNSNLTSARYVDSGLSLATISMKRLRMDAVGASLVDIHFASTVRKDQRGEFVDSEVVRVTSVRWSSIITIGSLVCGLMSFWILSIGVRSGIGTYNGLSHQYDHEMAGSGNSAGPQHAVTVGLVDGNDDMGERIGYICRSLSTNTFTGQV